MSTDPAESALDQLQSSLPEETDDQRVLDPGEYTDKRRLQDIHDARRMALQAPAILQEYPLTNAEMASQYHTILEYYLSEIQPLALTQFPERGEQYWNDLKIHVQEVEPPDTLTEPSTDYKLQIVEEADPVTIEYVGLRSLVNRPGRWQQEFTARGYHRKEGRSLTELTDTKDVHIPMRVLKTGRDLAGRFLAEIGMDVDVSKEMPAWGFEEVEEDREA